MPDPPSGARELSYAVAQALRGGDGDALLLLPGLTELTAREGPLDPSVLVNVLSALDYAMDLHDVHNSLWVTPQAVSATLRRALTDHGAARVQAEGVIEAALESGIASHWLGAGGVELMHFLPSELGDALARQLAEGQEPVAEHVAAGDEFPMALR